MPGWDDINKELGSTPSQIDYVRRKYLKQFADFRNRAVIAYYSAWLEKPQSINMDINDSDMEGFMNALRDVDCSKGLDLILHTPGGSPTATEAIVNYLKDKFNGDIIVIVPQIAMSAGTLMACSAKEIIMGKQSSLGPVDPQFNGIPAENIVQEFIDAKLDLEKNPQNAQYWAIKLQQYPAAFMKSAIDAIELSKELSTNWLKDGMLSGKEECEINKTVMFLNDHKSTKVHDRHFNYKECKENGLKIELMEDDDELQDKILSVHHAFMITLGATSTVKIIGNHLGKDFILSN